MDEGNHCPILSSLRNLACSQVFVLLLDLSYQEIKGVAMNLDILQRWDLNVFPVPGPSARPS